MIREVKNSMNSEDKKRLESLTIVKVGGAVVESEERLKVLLKRFAAIKGRKILVHGGGRRATAVAEKLGVESRMINGRRITSAQMLEVATMVYGGLVNKNIVARLQALGVNAVGLTGADMHLVLAHRRPVRDGVDYGHVGDIDEVNAGALSSLLEIGAMPVIAPLSYDDEGHLLNTNADTMASTTAVALAKDYDTTLTYAFEKRGVLADAGNEGSVIPIIRRHDFERYAADGTISGGMLPKIENALKAVEEGVGRVIITSAEAIGTQQGTTITL